MAWSDDIDMAASTLWRLAQEQSGATMTADALRHWRERKAYTLDTALGATWVSLHHGGGVGMGFSQYDGMVIVCDGAAAAAKRIARVLWNDPATGVMRHADAGYPEAVACAREQGLKLPSLGIGA